MDNRRQLGCGMLAVAGVWLLFVTAYLYSGLASGKLQDLSALILGLGLFGIMPAAVLSVGAVLVFARARGEARLQQQADLQTQLLERVQTQGRCKFADLARDLQLSPQEVEGALYALVGLGLFTGYVNWPAKEIIAAEASQLPAGKCPNCGGEIELAGRGVARCAHCGTETYLPPGSG
jgi:hypothetical protein